MLLSIDTVINVVRVCTLCPLENSKPCVHPAERPFRSEQPGRSDLSPRRKSTECERASRQMA
jgi:hypothetical protein